MNIETQVKKTLKKIKISKKEKILVAVSGGKDSSVTAYLLHKFRYNIEAIHINLGMGIYSEKCLNAVEKLCENLKIKLHVYDIKKEMGKTMPEIFKSKDKKSNNCFLCGVIKKWILNKKARELKADKIATGHNFNDELETFLINIFKGSLKLSANSGPILKTKDKKFTIRIKPLFFIDKKRIEDYIKKLNIKYVRGTCPYRKETYRVEARHFIKKLSDKEKENLMKNLLELAKKIKKDESEIKYCKICKEPSRKEICKKCELLYNKAFIIF